MDFPLLPGCKTTAHAECCLDHENVLAEEIDGSVLKLGYWPSHESAEKYLLCFYCSERRFLNFFHPLAPRANSPPWNTKVFILAMESGLARGHPWCSAGCSGKSGIRKLSVTGRRKQLRSVTPASFINLAPVEQCCKCCLLQDAGDIHKFFQILAATLAGSLWAVLGDSLVRLARKRFRPETSCK